MTAEEGVLQRLVGNDESAEEREPLPPAARTQERQPRAVPDAASSSASPCP